jgi:hypothetical protein
MKIDDIAKQLANKVNQEHYIKHYLEKVQRGAYNKGVKDAEAEQLILSGVSKSFKTELEMHEIATEKYQEHNFGDAKYDGFMDCYRMLVKETKNKTSLSK